LPAVLRLYISVALQQKAANFKVALASRKMQWSTVAEEKQKNQLAQTEFHFIRTIIIMSAEEITISPPPLYQRCTGAKGGKLQGDR
jgi:hypothetical protein